MKPNINHTIWKFYAFTFLWNLHLFSAVLVPFFTDWGGISLAQVQIVQSWFMFWIFFMEVPTGVIADYFGRKYSLTLGGVIITIGAVVYGSIPSFEGFLLAEFLFAVAFALLSGADQALLYDSLKEAGMESESKKIFGRAHAIRLSGILVGALFGGFIAQAYGLNAPMLATAIPFFLATILAWSLPEPKIHEQTSESKRYLDIAKKGISYLRGHKNLRILALDSVVVSSAAYFVIWLYQPLLQRVEFPVIYFGVVHALLVVAQIIISSNFSFFEKLCASTKAFLQYTALITALSFLLVVIYPHIVTIMIFVICGGGFGLTRIELMNVYMNKLIPSEQRATVLSSISMLRRFALVPLNPFIGFVADASIRLAMFILVLLPLSVFFFSPIEKEIFEDSHPKNP